MPIDAGTLQRIAQGGPLIKNTLAGQISDRRRADQAQQFEMQSALQKMMMQQQKNAVDARRKAVQSSKDRLEMQEKLRNMSLRDRFGFATKISRMPPDQLQQRIAQNPEGPVATFLKENKIDPNSPALGQEIRALAAGLEAQSEGSITAPGERALPAPTGSPLHRALGLDSDVGQEIKYVGEAPYVNEDGEVVNKENITNFESLGVTKEKREEIGGAERAGGPLTKEDVIYPEAGDFPVPKGLEMASGPRDVLVSSATRIPGVNEFMKYLAGDPDYGEEERIASRIGDELENLTIMAFKPSEDDRTSNLQIQLAQKISPRMGFLTTDDSVRTDLETLHARTDAKLEKQLSIANNKKFTEDTRKKAEQRANQLGNLLSLTSPLLQSAKDPRFVVENIMGKVTENATAEEILPVLSRVSDRQRKAYLSAISKEKLDEIKEAASK